MELQLIINNDRTIEDVNKDFMAEFPYLKIQFFKHCHKENIGSPKKEMLPVTTQIKILNHVNGVVVITPDQTVQELETFFKSHFNLNAQVFRKSGNNWLETTLTDSWTLQKQNQEGMELSNLGR
jgi:hypothetical protein